MLENASTPASGVRKVGMEAAFSTARASFTVVSPIQQVKSGLLTDRCVCTSACATRVGSAPSLGE